MGLRAILFLTAAAVITTGAGEAVASAPEAPPVFELEREMRVNEAETGTLLLRRDGVDALLAAPMVATDVKMDINGPVVRTTVSQTFRNSTDQWVEGVYVFPLPTDAAVDRLRMVVGGRLIEGKIEEKVKARAVYEQAKAEGRKASLVEQQRPNMFTTSVANIGPGESVAIQIEYQDRVTIKNGVFSTRFPMTVAPRYSPDPDIVQVATAEGTMPVILDPVLDRDAISPPLMPPALEPVSYMRLPVTLSVDLDAGFDLSGVDSAYHTINTTRVDADSATITLAAGEVPANRDFLLEWTPKPSPTPYASAFTQVRGDYTYVLSLMTPPDIALTPRSRESIFVIDTSGSMNGTSIEQARASLLLALDQLRPDDSFNMIRFSNDHTGFAADAVPATPQNLARARRWVSRLKAEGGTEMSPALAEALTVSPDASESGRLRQVIFITDGAIGNERQLFAQIQDDLGQSRLFPVGIGSAPNSYFMSRAAKFGRGTYVQIGDISEVQSRMGDFLTAIDSPLLVGVDSSAAAERFPSRLPDLYRGDALSAVSRYRTAELPDRLEVTGQLAGQDWRQTLSLGSADSASGLDVLWARAKIADLEERRFDRDSAADIDTQILQTALDHHIVSRLTSLVAVDVTPSRPQGEGLETAPVPTQLPEGWTFAERAQLNAPARRVRPPAANPQTAPDQLRLPNTASPHQVLGLFGGLMILFGLLGRRRRRVG